MKKRRDSEVVLSPVDGSDLEKTELNKSKTGLVRSTNFLVLARSPGHQESRTLLRFDVGPLVQAGLNLEVFSKIFNALTSFVFFHHKSLCCWST